jgi:hypothetical protein
VSSASINAVGALGWVVSINRNELLINVVKFDKPKMLSGLNQKVRGRMLLLTLEAHGQQDRRRIGRV